MCMGCAVQGSESIIKEWRSHVKTKEGRKLLWLSTRVLGIIFLGNLPSVVMGYILLLCFSLGVVFTFSLIFGFSAKLVAFLVSMKIVAWHILLWLPMWFRLSSGTLILLIVLLSLYSAHELNRYRRRH